FVADPYKEYSQPWFGTHKVLRGGCWATSSLLIRSTWRNFYTPDGRAVWAGFRTCAKYPAHENPARYSRAVAAQQRQQDHRAALGENFHAARPSRAPDPALRRRAVRSADRPARAPQRGVHPPLPRPAPAAAAHRGPHRHGRLPRYSPRSAS